MKLTSIPATLLCLSLLAAPAFAQTDQKKTLPIVPGVKLAPQPPDKAAPKVGADGQVNEGFAKSHANYVKIAREGKAQLAFYGDSITAGWAGGGKEVWAKAFGKYQPANFGIGGDRTQHVLWRIENGELDGIKPKATVLMIGTNNAGGDSAEGIAAGIRAILDAIHRRSPGTKVLLLAVFPRGDKPDGKFNAAHEKLKKVNAIIAQYADGKKVHYLDIGEKFLVDGKLTKEIMPDFLHLSAAGYQIWADAITPKLAELMK
ncbi:MAG: GDSL family lipase [Verrucomicrobia bacterium]|nr:GDSL family lipase [Verrucomicrobiota bacterium]